MSTIEVSYPVCFLATLEKINFYLVMILGKKMTFILYAVQSEVGRDY